MRQGKAFTIFWYSFEEYGYKSGTKPPQKSATREVTARLEARLLAEEIPEWSPMMAVIDTDNEPIEDVRSSCDLASHCRSPAEVAGRIHLGGPRTNSAW